MCPEEIEVACHNGPESSTISGPADTMKGFVETLTARGIFAKEVPCSNIAYHSRYIAEAGKLHFILSTITAVFLRAVLTFFKHRLLCSLIMETFIRLIYS